MRFSERRSAPSLSLDVKTRLNVNELSQPPAPKFRLSRLFWVGFVGFVLGTGPLLTVILFAALGWTNDPNPNPIGFGLLAGLTLWPSLGLAIAGVAKSVSVYRAARKNAS